MASAKAAKRTALNSVARSSFVQCSIAFGAGYAAWWLWERCTTPAHGDIPVSAVPTSRSVPLRDEETPTTAADKREESPLNTSCPSVEDLVITSPTKPSVPPSADDTGVETADASTTQDLSLLEKIDGWYATREHARCVKLLRSQLATPASTANAGPSRVALMWRLARAQRTLVSRARASSGKTSDAQRTTLVKAREMLEEAERMCPQGCTIDPATCGISEEQAALEAKTAEAMVHKWLAIIWNDLGDIDGKKAKLENGAHFALHLETAMKLAPWDPTLRYMHGRFNAALAELSWMKRALAATIFGREPPQATWSDALASFEEAARLRPEGVIQPMDQLGIAECHIKLGARAEARAALSRCIAAPSTTSEDDEAHAAARKLLTGL